MRGSLAGAALVGLLATMGLIPSGAAQAVEVNGSASCSVTETCEVWSVADTGTVAHFRGDTLMGSWRNSGIQTRYSYHGSGVQSWRIITQGALYSYNGWCVACSQTPPGTLC